jgi:hypothetical protein
MAEGFRHGGILVVKGDLKMLVDGPKSLSAPVGVVYLHALTQQLNRSVSIQRNHNRNYKGAG